MADTSPANPKEPAPTGPVAALQRLDGAVGLLEQIALCVLLLVLIGVASGQAIANRLFDESWGWSHEIIRYSVFFIAMTGAALSAQNERMISMDFVFRLLQPRVRAWVRQVLRLFAVVVCGFLILGGLQLKDVVAGEDYEVVSKSMVALALPAGGALIAFHLALHFIVDLMYLVRGKLPPEAQEVAAH